MKMLDGFISRVNSSSYTSLAVIGSQKHSDEERMKGYLQYILDNTDIDTIICSNAPGIDQITQQVAEDNHLHLITIEPEDGNYTTGSRIQEIIEEADCTIAFNDHGTPGTKKAIAKAIELGKYFFEHRIVL